MHVLPNTLNVSFKQLRGYEIVSRLGDRVCCSAGSGPRPLFLSILLLILIVACHSDTVSVSPVLKAMGIPVEQAVGAVRFSTGSLPLLAPKI